MAVRPIPFSDIMVSALREGRKTQTRRATTRENTFFNGGPWPKELPFGDCNWQTALVDGGPSPAGNVGPYLHVEWPYGRVCDGGTDEVLTARIYPKIQVGDRLYVRESYYQFGHWEPITGAKTKGGKQKWGFVADAPCVKFDMFEPYLKAMDRADPTTPAWHKRLGRFMPRAASRMTLIVTAVRVQRLGEINAEDAVAEGLKWVTPTYGIPGLANTWNGDPRASYAALWNTINGPDAWEANPWVPAISFTVHHCNVDKMEPRL